MDLDASESDLLDDLGEEVTGVGTGLEEGALGDASVCDVVPAAREVLS